MNLSRETMSAFGINEDNEILKIINSLNDIKKLRHKKDDEDSNDYEKMIKTKTRTPKVSSFYPKVSLVS